MDESETSKANATVLNFVSKSKKIERDVSDHHQQRIKVKGLPNLHQSKKEIGKDALFVETETTPETPLCFKWVRPRPEIFFSDEFKKRHELKLRPGDVTIDLSDLLFPPPFMSNWVPKLDRNIEYRFRNDLKTDNEIESEPIEGEKSAPFDLSNIIKTGVLLLKDNRDIDFACCQVFEIGQSNILDRLCPRYIETSILAITEEDKYIHIVLAILIMLPKCFNVREKEKVGHYIITILAPSLFHRLGSKNIDLNQPYLKSLLVQLSEILVTECGIRFAHIVSLMEERENDIKSTDDFLTDELLCCIGECLSVIDIPP